MKSEGKLNKYRLDLYRYIEHGMRRNETRSDMRIDKNVRICCVL